MIRCKSLDSLKSFLSYTSHLSGPVSCFSHPECLRAHCREQLQLTSVLSFPSSLRLSSWCWSGDKLFWLRHLLFTDMEGNIPLLTCHLFFNSYLCPVSRSHQESKYLPYGITCYLFQNTCPLQLLSPGYTFQSFYPSFRLCVMLWFIISNMYLVFVSFLAESLKPLQFPKWQEQ